MIKLHFENAKNESAIRNLNASCDIEFMIKSDYIFQLFNCVHTLVKIA